MNPIRNTLYPIPDTRYPILKLLLLTMLICGLWTMDYGLIYGQDDYLNVKGNIKANTLTFRPFPGDTGGRPSTPVEGELFYDHSDSSSSFINQPIYHDGSQWNPFLSQLDKFAATHIVATTNPTGPSKDPLRAEADYICEGEEDCSEVINQAISDLPAAGGSVYLLDGVYLIGTPSSNQPITINRSDVSLIGQGNSTVLKLRAGFGYENYIIDARNVDRLLISQLKIDASAGTGGGGIYLQNVSHSKINKVFMYLSEYGVSFNGASNNTITECTIQSISGYCSGIRLGPNPSPYNIISDNYIVNFGIGIEVSSNNNNTIINNLISSTQEAGILVQQSSGNVVASNSINSSKVGNGIKIDGFSTRNTISDNTISSVTGEGIALLIGCNNNLVSGNTIIDNIGHGILIKYAQSNSIIDNIISRPNTAWVDFDGIRLERLTDETNASKYNLIASNWISPTTPYGIGVAECPGSCWINIGPDCTDNYLVGNFLIDRWDATGSVKDGSTFNAYTSRTKMSVRRGPVFKAISGQNPQIDPNKFSSSSPVALTFIQVVGRNSTDTANADVALQVAEPIKAGSAIGDILILEGISNQPGRVGVPCKSNTTRLYSSKCKSLAGTLYRPLGVWDILELIWNGTYWLEVMYEDNYTGN